MSTISLVGAAPESVDDVFAESNSTRAGLISAESAHRLTVHGQNVLADHGVTVAGVLARQLRNPLLILLAGLRWCPERRVIRPTPSSSV
ncbi:MAG: cation-transporting P-type ATPase [Ilumatobacteraceae bacterium]